MVNFISSKEVFPVLPSLEDKRLEAYLKQLQNCIRQQYTAFDDIDLSELPTSDPGVVGKLWVNGAVLTVSV